MQKIREKASMMMKKEKCAIDGNIKRNYPTYVD